MTPFPAPLFETERLFLRPTTTEDAVFLLELLNTPKWLKFIGDRKVYSVEDAIQYINEKITPQQERLGFSNFTVIRKSDGTKIGSCGLYDREGLEGVDIGFAFLPQYAKQGYGFESANRMKKAALEDFSIKIISAITAQENTDSQKLIKKLGFQFKEIVYLPNDSEGVMLYQFKSDTD